MFFDDLKATQERLRAMDQEQVMVVGTLLGAAIMLVAALLWVL